MEDSCPGEMCLGLTLELAQGGAGLSEWLLLVGP